MEAETDLDVKHPARGRGVRVGRRVRHVRRRVAGRRIEEECVENRGGDEGNQRWTKDLAFIQ